MRAVDEKLIINELGPYSPHKLAFQNTMRVGDKKLMIYLE